MTLRIVASPLAPSVELPTPRDGQFDPALADAIIASPARDALLARLREPGAFVVTTGQQPGLFTGPLYTIYKAISTAALARVLERQWQRPAVPVFWVAGDDHDFTEASQASWISGEGTLVTGAFRRALRRPRSLRCTGNRWDPKWSRSSSPWLPGCRPRSSGRQP